jgi:hypothetical protein
MALRVCPGGDCERKTDCRRHLERKNSALSEVFPIAPFRQVLVAEVGVKRYEQVCDEFLMRETA